MYRIKMCYCLDTYFTSKSNWGNFYFIILMFKKKLGNMHYILTVET